MALDHYISQVYLKNFYSKALSNRIHAIRKRDLKAFTPRAKDVCRIQHGSTNSYLKDDRHIERFLRQIEPRYNASVEKIRADTIDEECIATVAGFVAFVVSCTPTAMRLFVKPLQNMVRAEAEILEKRGQLTPSPPELGGKMLPELLDDGTVEINIDQKFPQALGLNGILGSTSLFGNAHWDILINTNPNSLFFTSDFPAAMERPNINVPANRIVPLAPDLAVRIITDPRLARSKPDLHFSKFRYRRRKPDATETVQLNRLIVRCAEDLVFFRDEHQWIPAFVAKNRGYRIDTAVDRFPTGTGFMTLSTLGIVKA